MTPPPENLQIEREEEASQGRYVVRLDGAEAEMTYTRVGDKMIINNEAACDRDADIMLCAAFEHREGLTKQ